MSKFRCVRCGKCCKPVPFTTNMFERFKHLAQRDYVPLKWPLDKMYVLPRTQDNKCIFLKEIAPGVLTECVIYKNRTKTCRQQGIKKSLPCPFNVNLHDPAD